MKKFIAVLLGVLLGLTGLVFGFSSTHAAVPTIESNLIVTEGSESSAPLFYSGQRVEIKADLNSDVYILADEAVIESEINGDVTIVARDLKINGIIKGDLRAVAYNTVISGKVVGISTLASVQVVIEATTSDLFVAALTAGINGIHTGDTWAYANQLFLNGIFENVHTKSRLAQVLEKTVINGKYSHVGNVAPILEQGAQVEELQFKPTTLTVLGIFEGIWAYAVLFLAYYIVTLLITSLFYLFGKPLLEKGRTQASRKLFNTTWIGIGIYLFGFLLLFSTFLTKILWPLGVVVVAYLLVSAIYGYAFFVHVAGRQICNLFWKNKISGFLPAVLGSLLISILLFVPLLGPMMILAVALLGAGNLTILLWRGRLRRQ